MVASVVLICASLPECYGYNLGDAADLQIDRHCRRCINQGDDFGNGALLQSLCFNINSVTGVTGTNAYSPDPPVVWVRVVFLSRSTSVTVAPGTTFPWASETVPRTEDVPLCPNAGLHNKTPRQNRLASQYVRLLSTNYQHNVLTPLH